jgi:hypothetical protein
VQKGQQSIIKTPGEPFRQSITGKAAKTMNVKLKKACLWQMKWGVL